MRRLAPLAAAALALAGTASASTFAVAPAVPLVLPSAETPNVPGSLRLPEGWTAGTPAPRTVSPGELRGLWERAGAAYGIPWPVLAAINKIETNYGGNMGPSSAGAVGWMQFMPETWLRWGMDGNGDGVADPWAPEDAIFAAARYLAAAGGARDLPRAVFAYNHAQWYVDQVLALAGELGDGRAPAGRSPAGPDPAVVAAERAVVAANRALAAALERAGELARVERERRGAVDGAVLLSDRIARQRTATLAGIRHAAARAELDRLRTAVGAAEEELDEARAAARGVDFAVGAPVPAGTPGGDGWVFPVGGGPAVVSVPRDHHDYPAADIAAPAGAPVFALNAAVVVGSWRLPDARCGIGAVLRTEDGRSWTYCHLSYLEPAVVPGAVLAAGAPVGLVGSTGHSTGPHLHLQLRPATSYPQAEPWFARLAGVAFSWRGEEPAGRVLASTARRGPRSVFAVVPEPADEGAVVAFTR